MRINLERRKKQFVLFVGDIAIFYLSLFLSLAIRQSAIPRFDVIASHLGPFSFALLGWIIVYYTAGLYNLDVVFNDMVLLRRIVVASTTAALSTVLMFYLVQQIDISPKTVLAIFSALVLILCLGWRMLFAQILKKSPTKRGVVFVGLSSTVHELVASRAAFALLGYEVRFILVEDEDGGTGHGAELARLTDDRKELSAAIESGEVELVVISDESKLASQTRVMLFNLLPKEPRYMSLPDFYELAFRRIPLGEIDETWFLENIDLRSKRPYLAFKRMTDLVLSLLLIAVSAPLWPIIALVIKLESRGPVFFTQERLGRAGKCFRMIKFRTMRADRNDYAPTAAGDPRITRLGAFLRKSRIDEIPQVLNILKGDMSFIGPRPERPEFARELTAGIPYYEQRLLVKPGITGWDQVSGEYHSPSLEDTYKKLQSDLYYVKNLGLILDISILFKTVLTVLLRAGR